VWIYVSPIATGGGRFLSFARLEKRLRGTGIACVPVLAHRTFRDASEVLPLLDSKSAFRSDGGFVEGVYLRLEGSDGFLEQRCKLVK
jgi:hypothetical protein